MAYLASTGSNSRLPDSVRAETETFLIQIGLFTAGVYRHASLCECPASLALVRAKAQEIVERTVKGLSFPRASVSKAQGYKASPEEVVPAVSSLARNAVPRVQTAEGPESAGN